jgi:hypothetical protein
MGAVTDGRFKAGDKYTEQRIYVVGALPKTYRGPKRNKYPRGKVCWPFEGQEWYVTGYYEEENDGNPFAVKFILGPWDVGGTIDEYEPKKYMRGQMSVRRQETAKEIAHRLKCYLDDACGDMAHDSMDITFDEKTTRKIAKARRNGVQDVEGWLADEFYNDVGFITDLIGDRLYDESNKDIGLRNEILDELERHGHTAMKKAAKRLRRD